MKTIIRGARVLTMDPVGTQMAQATVTVENDIIVAVDDGVAPPGPDNSGVRTIEASGHLLMPGLVNAHFHSPANHLKGSFDSLPLEIFMLFETPAEGHTGRSPGRLRVDRARRRRDAEVRCDHGAR